MESPRKMECCCNQKKFKENHVKTIDCGEPCYQRIRNSDTRTHGQSEYAGHCTRHWESCSKAVGNVTQMASDSGMRNSDTRTHGQGEYTGHCRRHWEPCSKAVGNVPQMASDSGMQNSDTTTQRQGEYDGHCRRHWKSNAVHNVTQMASDSGEKKLSKEKCSNQRGNQKNYGDVDRDETYKDLTSDSEYDSEWNSDMYRDADLSSNVSTKKSYRVNNTGTSRDNQTSKRKLNRFTSPKCPQYENSKFKCLKYCQCSSDRSRNTHVKKNCCGSHNANCYMPSKHSCHPVTETTSCKNPLCAQWYDIFNNVWRHFESHVHFTEHLLNLPKYV